MKSEHEMRAELLQADTEKSTSLIERENPKNEGRKAQGQWKIAFLGVIEELKVAVKGFEKQVNPMIESNMCGCHERATSGTTKKLKPTAELGEMNHADANRGIISVRPESQLVSVEDANAARMDKILLKEEKQRKQALKTEKELLKIVSAEALLNRVEALFKEEMEEKEPDFQQPATRPRVANVLHQTERVGSFSSSETQDQERIHEERNGMRLVLGSKVVLHRNLYNIYDVEYLEERRCVTRLSSVQTLDIYLEMRNGIDYRAEESLMKRELQDRIGLVQDTRLSTASGATTPAHYIRGVSSSVGNRSISRNDTFSDGTEWEDAGGGQPWGPEFFLHECESTTCNDQCRFSTDKMDPAEDDLPDGWTQTLDFTEMLLCGNTAEEETGYGSDSNVSDKPSSLSNDEPLQDTVVYELRGQKHLPYQPSERGTCPPCVGDLTHYSSFLNDTYFIEAIRWGRNPV